MRFQRVSADRWVGALFCWKTSASISVLDEVSFSELKFQSKVLQIMSSLGWAFDLENIPSVRFCLSTQTQRRFQSSWNQDSSVNDVREMSSIGEMKCRPIFAISSCFWWYKNTTNWRPILELDLIAC